MSEHAVLFAYPGQIAHLRAMSHEELVEVALNEQISNVIWKQRCRELEKDRERRAEAPGQRDIAIPPLSGGEERIDLGPL